MMLVKGMILFDDDVEPLTGAIVYVRLEDVSRVDAPAKIAAEQVIRGVRTGGDVRFLHFAIRGDEDELEPHARYVVRVHVDVDNDGEVSVGDYVSTASHPIFPNSLPATVSIPVHRV
jgi:uncharacterized lipoprotein YbaY